MKKNITKAMLTAAIMVLPSLASATPWNIDADHSNVGFSVSHLMVSHVKGNFNKYSGVVDINDKDITKSKVDVTIDASSINTNVQKRDEHLKSADFFDVAKYPTLTFVSKKWSKAAKGALKVTGDLTIHGVTKSVVLTVAPFSKESKDPWGNTRRGTSASTTINRKDYGLVWNQALETGGVAVGEEVNISLDVELIKAQIK
ncbi:MAG: polyisoprenoid-binding protein [Chlorobiaceae bacterium]|nr:polyisoprenoid-binding protein [Chlorobiaceae bacterium]